MSLAHSPSPSVHAQAVLFSASVVVVPPGAGTPTGTVTFMDGATTLASVALGAGGVATYSTAGLAVGNHTITASYGGSALCSPSTGTVTHTVS